MRYDFGRCHLDTVNREVTLDGVSMHLSPKAFELLRLLVEGRDREDLESKNGTRVGGVPVSR